MTRLAMCGQNYGILHSINNIIWIIQNNIFSFTFKKENIVMNSMNTMANMINNGGRSVKLTVSGTGSYNLTKYSSYTILAATSGTVTVLASKKIKIGYLIVGGGANVNSLQYGGAGGQVIIRNLSNSTTYLNGNTAYTLKVGVGGSFSSISGNSVGITAIAGSTLATSSNINGTVVLAGAAGFNNGFSTNPPYTGGNINGATGINLTQYPITDINLNGQFLGGGGAAHSGGTAAFGGWGGGGGNDVLGNYGDTGYYLTTYGNGSTFGEPGQAGLGEGGAGGANTGGGGGGYFSTGGSGVVLIYYVTNQ
jgi:hypothetical protein